MRQLFAIALSNVSFNNKNGIKIKEINPLCFANILKLDFIMIFFREKIKIHEETLHRFPLQKLLLGFFFSIWHSANQRKQFGQAINWRNCFCLFTKAFVLRNSSKSVNIQMKLSFFAVPTSLFSESLDTRSTFLLLFISQLKIVCSYEIGLDK